MERNSGRRICILLAIVFLFNINVNAVEKGGGNGVSDILLHYTISAELSFASCMFFTIKKPEMPLAKKYIISASFASLAGLGKEMLDASRDEFDPADLGWDALGIGSGILIHWLLIDRTRQKGNLSFQFDDHSFSARFILNL